MKHTPGPWSYSTYEGSNHCKIYLHGLGRIDKIKGGDSLQGYCGEENARLIAAAPELLEILLELQDIVFLTRNNELHTLIEAAIAKAKGDING